MNHEEIWKNVLTELELSISKASFITWFRETSIADINENAVTISVPSGFAKTWLQDKYHKIILRALRNTYAAVREISYVVGPVKPSDPARIKLRAHPLVEINQDRLELKDAGADPESGLNPKYTFENFVVGSFNELAHAAAQAIIKNPGLTYNPLFVYGGVGLGKTHLIQAIGNEMIKQHPGLKARYLASEKFMGEIVDAINDRTMNRLKEKYRSVDLLIMDDIQFIARTEKIQEEFFHAFNTLYEKNKQIIISSDKPPASIPTLEHRLRSRFEGGMIADIGEPDYETRLAILKAKLRGKSATMPEDVLEYIAETVKSNIRDLEGALNRLILRATMSAVIIDAEEAKKILFQVAASARRFISPKKVIRVVAEFYDISEKELVNRSRRKEIVKPRQVAMFILRDELKCSFPFIGERLGKKDHTTAIHACKKVAAGLASDPTLEMELKTIKERLYSTA